MVHNVIHYGQVTCIYNLYCHWWYGIFISEYSTIVPSNRTYQSHHIIISQEANLILIYIDNTPYSRSLLISLSFKHTHAQTPSFIPVQYVSSRLRSVLVWLKCTVYIKIVLCASLKQVISSSLSISFKTSQDIYFIFLNMAISAVTYHTLDSTFPCLPSGHLCGTTHQ